MQQIENVINFWNRQPCNVKHSNFPIGTRDYFNAVQEKRYFVEPHIRSFADFENQKGKVILEIGSGIGVDAINFALNGAKVYSGDISSKSIEIAKINAQNFPNIDLHFFVHNFESMPVVKNNLPDLPKLDLIYSFGVIHHSPNPNLIFKNIAELANEDTEIKIMLYHRWSTKAIALYLKHGIFRSKSFDESVAVQSEAQSGSPFTHTYSKNRIKKQLEAVGLRIHSLQIQYIFPYQIDLYKMNIYKYKWYWKLFPKFIFRKLEKLVGWHLLICAKKFSD